MAAEALEHVVEEADAGIDVAIPRPVQVEGETAISVSRVLRSTVAVRIVHFSVVL